MAYVTMKELLGQEFVSPDQRWNPKMKPYIFGAPLGIYIVACRRLSRCSRRPMTSS
jgi:small subunit ribosomal protein S2